MALVKTYIFAEDLASGLIGPFESENAAHNHVTYCRMRRDADPGRVVTEREAFDLQYSNRVDLVISPEEDVYNGVPSQCETPS